MSNETDNIALATELTIAWLSNQNTRTNADDVPAFISSMHNALSQLGTSSVEPQPEAEREYTPAVSVRKSLASKDHIISMIDGKPYKTLRRHLSGHGLTPEQYRERFRLKADYPMVAEAYSEARRSMAKAIGLGRKPGQTVARKEKGAGSATRKSGKAAPEAATQAAGATEE